MFTLDLKSRRSIYEQVMDNVKESILTGVLKAGEQLPSVREFSKRLTVNPNTVQKAFHELERQGYVYTVSGVGTFAHAREEILPDERRIAETRSRLAEDIRELYYLMADAEQVRREVSDTTDAVLQRRKADDAADAVLPRRKADDTTDAVLQRREAGDAADAVLPQREVGDEADAVLPRKGADK